MDPANLAEILGDLLRVFLGGVFLWYGYFDVRPSEARKAEFRRWGFGPAVQPAGGVLQFASVALLIVPATVVYGAGIILAMMLFSMYVHVAREYQPRQVLLPVVLACLAVLTAFLYGNVAWGPVGALFRSAFGGLWAGRQIPRPALPPCPRRQRTNPNAEGSGPVGPRALDRILSLRSRNQSVKRRVSGADRSLDPFPSVRAEWRTGERTRNPESSLPANISLLAGPGVDSHQCVSSRK